MNYEKGSVVTLKKPHACGENIWEIERLGLDIKIKCLGCEKSVWLKRTEFEKRVRKIKTKEGKMISIVHYDIKTGLRKED